MVEEVEGEEVGRADDEDDDDGDDDDGGGGGGGGETESVTPGPRMPGLTDSVCSAVVVVFFCCWLLLLLLLLLLCCYCSCPQGPHHNTHCSAHLTSDKPSPQTTSCKGDNNTARRNARSD